MFRLIAIGACALMLAACGTTATYLRGEYGSGMYDGTVTLDDGTGWWIWVHKTKPKLIVSVDPAQAAAIGATIGLTMGAASNSPPQPIFERVAAKWFAENRPECHTTRGYPIEKVYFEFEYECVPRVTQAVPSKR